MFSRYELNQKLKYYIHKLIVFIKSFDNTLLELLPRIVHLALIRVSHNSYFAYIDEIGVSQVVLHHATHSGTTGPHSHIHSDTDTIHTMMTFHFPIRERGKKKTKKVDDSRTTYNIL